MNSRTNCLKAGRNPKSKCEFDARLHYFMEVHAKERKFPCRTITFKKQMQEKIRKKQKQNSADVFLQRYFFNI